MFLIVCLLMSSCLEHCKSAILEQARQHSAQGWAGDMTRHQARIHTCTIHTLYYTLYTVLYTVLYTHTCDGQLGRTPDRHTICMAWTLINTWYAATSDEKSLLAVFIRCTRIICLLINPQGKLENVKDAWSFLIIIYIYILSIIIMCDVWGLWTLIYIWITGFNCPLTKFKTLIVECFTKFYNTYFCVSVFTYSRYKKRIITGF